MKTKDQLKPNNAPVYAAALYPDLAGICHKHGYALSVHGSLARDFDMIAIPWADDVSSHSDVLDEIQSTFAIKEVGEREVRAHGRIVHTLSVGFGECALDFSFMASPAPAIDLLTEVMDGHKDPDSGEFNDCIEGRECQWCIEAKQWIHSENSREDS